MAKKLICSPLDKEEIDALIKAGADPKDFYIDDEEPKKVKKEK